MSHVQVPPQQGKENPFIEGGKEVAGAVVNKEAVAFHGPSPHQGRGVFLLPVGLCYCCAM